MAIWLPLQVGQKQCLKEAGIFQGKARQAQRPQPQDDTKAHWWDTKTWEEFEEGNHLGGLPASLTV